MSIKVRQRKIAIWDWQWQRVLGDALSRCCLAISILAAGAVLPARYLLPGSERLPGLATAKAQLPSVIRAGLRGCLRLPTQLHFFQQMLRVRMSPQKIERNSRPGRQVRKQIGDGRQLLRRGRGAPATRSAGVESPATTPRAAGRPWPAGSVQYISMNGRPGANRGCCPAGDRPGRDFRRRGPHGRCEPRVRIVAASDSWLQWGQCGLPRG